MGSFQFSDSPAKCLGQLILIIGTAQRLLEQTSIKGTKPPALGERPPHPQAPAQAPGGEGDAIRGTALSLQAHRGTTVVGEMGTGKTFIATAAAHMAGFGRVLVLCPPHLTRKWKREVEETTPTATTGMIQWCPAHRSSARGGGFRLGRGGVRSGP